VDTSSFEQLLEYLKNPDAEIRDRATGELWRLWFTQKGDFGLELLRRSQVLMEVGDIDKAEELLNEIVNSLPDFAEAWNRKAVFYYMQGDYIKSKQDCERVVALNPHHFGAWHGLGLCHAALGDYSDASAAFRKALEIQPYSLVNQQLILECTTRLN